jgi:hypothetical protein
MQLATNHRAMCHRQRTGSMVCIACYIVYVACCIFGLHVASCVRTWTMVSGSVMLVGTRQSRASPTPSWLSRPHLCVCVCVCVYVGMGACVRACVRAHARMCVCASPCASPYASPCVHSCMHVRACVRAHTSAHVRARGSLRPPVGIALRRAKCDECGELTHRTLTRTRTPRTAVRSACAPPPPPPHRRRQRRRHRRGSLPLQTSALPPVMRAHGCACA